MRESRRVRKRVAQSLCFSDSAVFATDHEKGRRVSKKRETLRYICYICLPTPAFIRFRWIYSKFASAEVTGDSEFAFPHQKPERNAKSAYRSATRFAALSMAHTILGGPYGRRSSRLH